MADVFAHARNLVDGLMAGDHGVSGVGEVAAEKRDLVGAYGAADGAGFNFVGKGVAKVARHHARAMAISSSRVG